MFLRVIQLGRARLSRWSTVLSLLFLAGLVLIWSAPAIIGSRTVWPRVVSYLTRGLDATITTERVRLGWFAPAELHNVSVDDLTGQRVATLQTLRTEATLFSLLLGGSDFGKIVIEQPEIQVQLRPQGSNIEDILASYFSASESSSGATGAIEILDGKVTIEAPHRHDAAPARFEAIHAVVTLVGGNDNRGTVNVQSCRTAGADADGSLAAKLAWQSAGKSTHWSVATKIQSLDLSLLQPVLERLDLAVELRGTGSGTALASWPGKAQRTTVEVREATVRQLRLAAPNHLGKDQLAFDRVTARGSCSFANGSWQITGAQIDCDAGRVALDGRFAWPANPTTGALNQLITTAIAADLQVNGQIDLARLAATLPHTLRIREGAVIESGNMNFALQSGNQSGERKWTASINTTELTARRAGQQFTWNAPLQVVVEASQDAADWRVERLACTSSFLSLTGSGTPTAGSFSLQCDLQQLSDQVREFVELGSLQAAGTMSAQLDWKRSGDQRVTLHGTSLLENLELTGGPIGHWHEPRLSLSLAAQGEQGKGQPTRLQTAQIELASRTDRLVLQLLEPVESPGSDTLWMVGGHVSGQWETWFQRLRPLLPAAIPSHAWTVTGPVDLQVTSQISRRSIEIKKGTLTSRPFFVDSPQVRIDEPAIALELEGLWDFAAGRLRIPEATFQSEAVAFRISDLRVDPQGADSRTTGDITFRADLDRLYRTWRVPAKQHDWKLAGSAQGQVSLVHAEGDAQARWTIDLVGLALDRRQLPAANGNVIPATNTAAWRNVWREPILNVTGSGQCNLATETIALDRFDLKSADKLQLSIQGKLTEPVGACVVDLHGQVTYDLAKLLRQWAPELKNQVRWTGHDTQQFRLRGPLFQLPSDGAGLALGNSPTSPSAGMIPLALTGESGISWQSADILGIAVGAGAVAASLEAGTVHTGVIELPISGGTLRIEPTVYLNHQPPVVTLAPGQALTNVQITTGMCDQWLKYIAPVAADATRAEGQFSLSLGTTSIPLRQPAACRSAGTLKVHAASIGPGPLAQQLILAASRITTILDLRVGDVTSVGQNAWVRIPEQETQFQVVQGRVHHNQLVFEAGGATIYTQGSVGFDESLALIAQIPIQNQWIANKPQLAALRGHIVQVPVSGTLSDPRIDQRALERLATDALRQATGRIIQDEVNKGLQRWLGSGQ